MSEQPILPRYKSQQCLECSKLRLEIGELQHSLKWSQKNHKSWHEKAVKLKVENEELRISIEKAIGCLPAKIRDTDHKSIRLLKKSLEKK